MPKFIYKEIPSRARGNFEEIVKRSVQGHGFFEFLKTGPIGGSET